MKKRYFSVIMIVLCSLLFIGADPECDETKTPEQARSGVQMATANIQTQANGMTQEQENVKKRVEMENKPGNIQHLYILSAYSGQVLFYSTVKGKVTSSGKRLSPSTKVTQFYSSSGSYYPEILGDDGTYGPSIEYLYWWDIQGRYQQQYVTGGIFIHISDQPTQFGRVTLQVEAKEAK